MYNRYTPGSDGSYQRSRMPDKSPPPPPRRPPEPKPQKPSHPVQPPPAPPVCPPPRRPRPEAPAPSVGSFLKNLLPKDFDTEDLMVIILLLLMSRDSREDQNSALLTLALYLFL